MGYSRHAVVLVGAFAAVYVIWGSTYLALAVALHSLPPFLLMGTRSIVGGAVLLGCSMLAGGTTGTLRSWGVAAVCGLLFFVGCHGVLAYAQQSVPSGLAAVLLATIPFWIAALNTLLPGNDHVGPRTLLFLIPGLIGVGLIAWHSAHGGFSGAQTSGILLLLAASASWGIATVLSERYKGAASPAALSGMELLTGGVVLMIISVAAGEIRAFDPAEVTSASAAGWLYLTVAGTVITFGAYIWLLDQMSPTIVATYTFVNPIVAVLLGWLFLGEQLTIWTMVGAGLVIAAVAGLLLARHHSASGEPPAEREAPWKAQKRTNAVLAER
jgi:drug/metabolite transporter (DMT)-like permease